MWRGKHSGYTLVQPARPASPHPTAARVVLSSVTAVDREVERVLAFASAISASARSTDRASRAQIHVGERRTQHPTRALVAYGNWLALRSNRAAATRNSLDLYVIPRTGGGGAQADRSRRKRRGNRLCPLEGIRFGARLREQPSEGRTTSRSVPRVGFRGCSLQSSTAAASTATGGSISSSWSSREDWTAPSDRGDFEHGRPPRGRPTASACVSTACAMDPVCRRARSTAPHIRSTFDGSPEPKALTGRRLLQGPVVSADRQPASPI